MTMAPSSRTNVKESPWAEFDPVEHILEIAQTQRSDHQRLQMNLSAFESRRLIAMRYSPSSERHGWLTNAPGDRLMAGTKKKSRLP